LSFLPKGRDSHYLIWMNRMSLNGFIFIEPVPV